MKIFYSLCFLLFIQFLNGQNITGNITDLSNLPISNVNIHWKGTNISVLSDSLGNFSIPDHSLMTSTLVISHVGYTTENLNVGNIKHWKLQLMEDATLTEVEINTKSSASTFLNEVAKIEALGVREIQRAACCSLAGCFSTNSSVESHVTNVITDSKELRLLGLSGVYNQILVDGLPLIQGLSYPYGPGSFPGTMIQKIFIAKGANSVLQGYESITGQINMEFHDNESTPRYFYNIFANSFGETQYNFNHFLKKSSWSNLTTAHLTLPAGIIDRDKDGFRDIVKTNRISIYNRWSYDNPDRPNLRATIGWRYLDENREGGANEFSHKSHLGSDYIYGQNIDINHAEAYAKINYILGQKTSLILLTSAFRQEQLGYFGVKKYDALQFNNTTSLYADYYYHASNHNIKIGITHRHNLLNENISFTKSIGLPDISGIYKNNYDIPGIFAENKMNLFQNKVTAVMGVRLDRQHNLGWRPSPRLLVRYAANEKLDIRASIGRGYRQVSFWAENTALLASNRVIELNPSLKPESAWNTGINFIKKYTINSTSMTLSSDYYFTIFDNQIFPDYNTKFNTAIIDNYFGKSVSHSFQIENKIEFSQNFDVKLAYNYLDVYRVNNGKKVVLPFNAKHRWIANTSYSTPNDQWQIDLTYRWYGPRQLPSTLGYPEDLRISAQSPKYQQLDLQLTKRWKKFQIYGGIENISDSRQTFPILGYKTPFGQFFDPSFNWGPTKGLEVYIGIRHSI